MEVGSKNSRKELCNFLVELLFYTWKCPFSLLSQLHSSFREFLEPTSTREATSRAVEILDANYEKADLSKIIYDTCNHLTVLQEHNLLRNILPYKELFDGNIGGWQTEPVSFRLKPGSKPYHGRAFPIPHIHLKTLKKEVEQLVKLGVLKKQPSSE